MKKFLSTMISVVFVFGVCGLAFGEGAPDPPYCPSDISVLPAEGPFLEGVYTVGWDKDGGVNKYQVHFTLADKKKLSKSEVFSIPIQASPNARLLCNKTIEDIFAAMSTVPCNLAVGIPFGYTDVLDKDGIPIGIYVPVLSSVTIEKKSYCETICPPGVTVNCLPICAPGEYINCVLPEDVDKSMIAGEVKVRLVPFVF